MELPADKMLCSICFCFRRGINQAQDISITNNLRRFTGFIRFAGQSFCLFSFSPETEVKSIKVDLDDTKAGKVQGRTGRTT